MSSRNSRGISQTYSWTRTKSFRAIIETPAGPDSLGFLHVDNHCCFPTAWGLLHIEVVEGYRLNQSPSLALGSALDLGPQVIVVYFENVEVFIGLVPCVFQMQQLV